MILDATVDGRVIRVEVRERQGRYTVSLDGEPIDVELTAAGPYLSCLLVGGESHEVGLEKRHGGYAVLLPGETVVVSLEVAAPGTAAPPARAHGPVRVTAPMPGRVVRLLLDPGKEVVAGEGLVVVEAMKMENEVRAPRSGRVLEVAVREGQAVEAGALLAVVG